MAALKIFKCRRADTSLLIPSKSGTLTIDLINLGMHSISDAPPSSPAFNLRVGS